METPVKTWRRPRAQFRNDYKSDMPSMADPSFAPECDVNNIVKKYEQTGQITHLAKRAGTYADVSELPDLAEAFAIVDFANQAFLELPAEIREHLGNDPTNLEGFIQDPHNHDILLKYGMLNKPAASTLDDGSAKAPAPAVTLPTV